MVRDRLEELRARQIESSEDNGDVVIHFNNITANQMDKFFEEMRDIETIIDRMQTKVDEVKRIHNNILLTPVTDEKMQQHLESLMSDIKRYAVKARNQIKELERVNDEIGKTNQSSAEYRIRHTQHLMLSKKFVEVMNDYNMAQVEYRDKCKSKIQRQLEITGKVTTSEELEEMLEGDVSVFTQGILTDSQQARENVADIEARHAELMNLEKNIRDLHEMFIDMAVLVEQQGELINNIEYTVTSTVDFTEKGKENLKAANKFKTAFMKKKLLCYILLAVVIAVILIIVLTQVL